MATPINIKIKTLQNNQLELSIIPSILVSEMKATLSEKTSTPVENLRLIHMGKVLKDDHTIESYGIKENAVIHLVSSAKPPAPATSPLNSSSSVPPTSNSTNPPIANPMNLFGNQQMQFPPMNQMGPLQFSFSGPIPFPMVPQPGQSLPNGQQPQSGMAQQVVFRVPTNMVRQGQTGGPQNPNMMNFPFPFFNMPQNPQNPQNPPNTDQNQTHQNPTTANSSTHTSNDSTNPNSNNQNPLPQMMNLQAIPMPHPMAPFNNATNYMQPAFIAPSPMNQTDTDLDQAIVAGNMEKIKDLVENRHANVNRGGLHKACMFGHKEVVEYLISKGAKTEMRLAGGETALHASAFYGQKEIMTYLLDQCSANLYERTNDGKTSLQLAVMSNQRNVCEELLKRGASVHDNDHFGITSLILAAQKGNKEIAELMLQYKAQVDARDAKGRTALHFAAAGGHAGIIALLLQNGASINAQNAFKESPLHFATFHGRKDCLIFLLSKGADVRLVSQNGTALTLARSRNLVDIVSLLQQHGATE